MSAPKKTSSGRKGPTRRKRVVRPASSRMSVPVTRGPQAPRGLLIENEPLSRHTSWRVGGPARRYFEPADREDLIAFVRRAAVAWPPQSPFSSRRSASVPSPDRSV